MYFEILKFRNVISKYENFEIFVFRNYITKFNNFEIFRNLKIKFRNKYFEIWDFRNKFYETKKLAKFCRNLIRILRISQPYQKPHF
jgi:hypothetical protein